MRKEIERRLEVAVSNEFVNLGLLELEEEGDSGELVVTQGTVRKIEHFVQTIMEELTRD